jgi:hypothetical protein
MNAYSGLKFLAIATLVFAAPASATIIIPAPAIDIEINFQDLGVTEGSQLHTLPGEGVVSQGFNFTPGPNNPSGSNDLHISYEAFQAWNDSVVGSTHDDVVLSEVTGNLFSISSFDFAGFPDGGEDAFSVTGFFAGGGSISQGFVPDGIVDGKQKKTDFQTFDFDDPAAWTNLTSVQWDHTGGIMGLFALDNITVTMVPEPSSLPLLSIGLVVLAARRRKAN